MYRPVLKLLIIQQFALLLKSLFVIFSTFLIYGQSCNGHQKLIFSFLYKLPFIVDKSQSNFFALPNLLNIVYTCVFVSRLNLFQNSYVFFKAVQYMPHGCVVQFEVVYQGKNNSEVEISLCKQGTIGTEHGHSTLELAYSRCLQNAYFSQMRDSE